MSRDPKPERVVFHLFGYSIFPERGAGGGVHGGALISTVALLVCMPAGREDKYVGHFFSFALPMVF